MTAGEFSHFGIDAPHFCLVFWVKGRKEKALPKRVSKKGTLCFQGETMDMIKKITIFALLMVCALTLSVSCTKKSTSEEPSQDSSPTASDQAAEKESRPHISAGGEGTAPVFEW